MDKVTGIASWTDVDYAQAAIDMLPGTVEEIVEWMRVHRIENKWQTPRTSTCPVVQWINKWTEAEWVGLFKTAYIPRTSSEIVYPNAVVRYVEYADRWTP